MATVELEVAVLKEQIAEVKSDTEEIKVMLRDSVKPRLLEHDKDIATFKATCGSCLPKVALHETMLQGLLVDVAVLRNNWLIFTGITTVLAGAAVYLVDHFLG